MASFKGYKFKTDNKLKAFGETDWQKKTVRINKKKNKKTSKGELIDSIAHEKMHINHPKMKEKTVQKKTKQQVKKLNKGQKDRDYSLLKK